MHLAQNSQTPLLQTARITPFPYPRLVGEIPVLHGQSGPEGFSRREPSPPCGPVSPASRSPSQPLAPSHGALVSASLFTTVTSGGSHTHHGSCKHRNTKTHPHQYSKNVRCGEGHGEHCKSCPGFHWSPGGRAAARYLKPIPVQVGCPGGLGSGAWVGPR